MLILRPFNNQLCNTLRSIILPILVGLKTTHACLQVIKGEKQYNFLVGQPWIREMECVPHTLHGCVKYLEDGMVNCVWMDEEPFSHCNLIDLPDGPILLSTHIFLETILLDLDPPSLNTAINEIFQELKFEPINDLVPSKIEQDFMYVHNTEDISNVHRKLQEKALAKPSLTIQEEISWKV